MQLNKMITGVLPQLNSQKAIGFRFKMCIWIFENVF